MTFQELPTNYTVSGTIRDKQNGSPLAGLLIQAYDKDFRSSQFLGESRTNRNGYYKIAFTRKQFEGWTKLERHPDIYLNIFNEQGELIHSTKDSLLLNAGTHTTCDVIIGEKNKEGEKEEAVFIGGRPVILSEASRLSTDDLLDAYQLNRLPAFEPKNKDLILKAFPDILKQWDDEDDCGEGADEFIVYFFRERNAIGQIIEIVNAPMLNCVEEEFYTDNIVVKYYLGNNAICPHSLPAPFDEMPTVDTDFARPDGEFMGVIRTDATVINSLNPVQVPIYVQKIGFIAEHALNKFLNPPFSLDDPRTGTTPPPRVEYRIRNISYAGQTRPIWSHIEIKYNNSDTRNFFTVPHELVHRIQYAYNSGALANESIYGMLREGGARFLAESIHDRPNRYVVSANANAGATGDPPEKGIFPFPEESLLNIGSVCRTRYAAGLFWKYIAEQHSYFTDLLNEPAIGVDTYRLALEETASSAAGYTVLGLRNARRLMPWNGHFDQFRYLGADLDSHETTWGNFLIANYMHGLMESGDSDYDSRFDYKEDHEPVSWSASISQLADLQARVEPTNRITLAQGGSESRTELNHRRYAAYYYEIIPDELNSPTNVRISFDAPIVSAGNFTFQMQPLVQILVLGDDDSLMDIHRSDQTSYMKTIHLDCVEKIVVIVGNTNAGGRHDLEISDVPAHSDVMITRWNTHRAKEYEMNPRGWTWHWISPDVMVDTNDDFLADPVVFFDQNNKLKVRIRNKGNLLAGDIRIDYWYQKATPFLNPAGWIPVTDELGNVQITTGETLNPGQEKWIPVNWAPANDGSNHPHWCVKVQISSVGDTNDDNKQAFSNFSNVRVLIPPVREVFELKLIHPYIKYFEDINIIPRGPRYHLSLKNPEVLKKKKDDRSSMCACDDHPTRQVPNLIKWAKFSLIAESNRKPWDQIDNSHPNDRDFYYPVTHVSLPPGVNPHKLVTVSYTIDGEVVGGVSYQIEEEG